MSTVYDVSTVYELKVALWYATGGETIRMAGGDYGTLDLKTAYHDLTYDSPVTIVSADPDDPAIISEMTLDGASNITFQDITFKSYYTATSLWYSPFVVRNSDNITFDNTLFEGTPAAGFSEAENGTGRARGLFVEDSSDITVTDSEFGMWYRGLLFSNVDNLTVTNNDIHSIRSDGMTLGAIDGALIENNYIHDFLTVPGSGDHADMIQVSNLGNSNSSDLTFRGNTFDIGEGGTTQTLFIRNQYVDQNGAGVENYYENIIIEENVILNGHAHGITVGETIGLIIRNNTVLSIDPDSAEYASAPYIAVAVDSLNVVILDNVSQAISGHTGQASWQVDGNVLVQNHDPQSEGFYENEFVTSTLDDSSVEGITVRRDSIIAQTGVGAQQLLPDQSESNVEPLFNLNSVEHAPQSIVFDASETHAVAGGELPAGTTFHWDFGDGNTATGLTVQHTYAQSGVYAANLNVILPTGETYTETTNVELAGSAVLSMDTATGDFQQHHFGDSSDIAGSRAFTEAAGDGGIALAIGVNTGGVSVVPKEALARLFGTDTFEMSMTLQADLPGESHGEIARLHGSFLMKTDANGSLDLIVFLDTGAVRLTSVGVQLNDGQAHDISITFDGETSLLSVNVDGQEVGSVNAQGNMPGMTYYDMTFGNAWGKQTFEGQISNFSLDVDAYDYPVIEVGQIADVPPATENPTSENWISDLSTTSTDPEIVVRLVGYEKGESVSHQPATEPALPEIVVRLVGYEKGESISHQPVTESASYGRDTTVSQASGSVPNKAYWTLPSGNLLSNRASEDQVNNFRTDVIDLDINLKGDTYEQSWVESHDINPILADSDFLF